jgi:para-nitrobenzyl esterase
MRLIADCLDIRNDNGRSRIVQVQTSLGTVESDIDAASGVIAFLGVPYAAPPTGKLRFRPAVEHPGWTGVRNARRFGPASAQLFDPCESSVEELCDIIPEETPLWVGSEDSLTLNIWTPGTDDLRRPVIVYIHGGANWLESSRGAVYHGDVLAARGDAVVVTLNYRLGLFGFLDVSTLGPEAPQDASRNGLTDQLMAFDWIRTNILAFGGDPDNITLTGESAGSMNISWHLAAGLLAGGVSRIALMSGIASVNGFARGGTRNLHGLEEGKARAAAFWTAMGIESFAALQQLSTQELMERKARVVADSHILFDMDTLFYPRTLPQSPMDPFDAVNLGHSAELDMMIGFTSYEMGLWLLWDQKLDANDTAWAAAHIPGLPETLRADIAAHYDRVFAHEPPGIRAMHMLGDAMFVIPSVVFAEAHVRNGGRAWMYQFDHPGSDPRMRALHAADIVGFMGKYDTATGMALMGKPTGPGEADRRAALSDYMQRRLLAFAHGEDLTAYGWAAYDSAAPQILNFAAEPGLLDDPLADRWRWWRDNIIAPELGW